MLFRRYVISAVPGTCDIVRSRTNAVPATGDIAVMRNIIATVTGEIARNRVRIDEIAIGIDATNDIVVMRIIDVIRTNAIDDNPANTARIIPPFSRIPNRPQGRHLRALPQKFQRLACCDVLVKRHRVNHRSALPTTETLEQLFRCIDRERWIMIVVKRAEPTVFAPFLRENNTATFEIFHDGIVAFYRIDGLVRGLEDISVNDGAAFQHVFSTHVHQPPPRHS